MCRATKFNVRPHYQLLIDCLLNDAPSKPRESKQRSVKMYYIYVLYGVQLWVLGMLLLLEGSLLLCTGIGCTLLTLI